MLKETAIIVTKTEPYKLRADEKNRDWCDYGIAFCNHVYSRRKLATFGEVGEEKCVDIRPNEKGFPEVVFMSMKGGK